MTNNTNGQYSDNTPPVVTLDRNWVLPDTEPVGSIVTRVRAHDAEQDDLIYGLEPLGHKYNGDDSPQPPLPFTIDNKTGTIFLNETLKGRGGENLFLWVTVSDGQLTAKTEVYVNIENKSSPSGGHTRSPFPSQHGSGGRIRPPILSLPAISNYPRPPQIPPSSISNDNIDKPTILRPEKKLNKDINIDDVASTASTIPPTKITINNIENNEINNGASVSSNQSPPSQEIVITLVPIFAVFALILILGTAWWMLKNKFCISQKTKKSTKKQANVRVSYISDDPSLILKSWQNPKAKNNKYKDWKRENQLSEIRQKIDDKWEFPRHRLKVLGILGEGCFGQVWKSEAIDIDDKKGTSIVAVKTLKENATERERIDLAQELKVMKTLEPHPNVVRLIGCCTEREPMFVILEYVSGGKLQSFLRESREERNRGGPGLTSRDLTGFVYQISKGMEYLASKGIIHRDLAARNILIDNDRGCKVADFGFARDIAANAIYERKSEGRLPIRWMAPESLYDNIFSVKSDIWSFGVLIWEIVTLGSTPYPGMAAAEVMKKIKEGYRLDRPEHCKRELYNIMYYCWDKDPNCRPLFGELVGLTEGLLLDETDYIELDRFPDHSYYNVLNLSGEKL
ncbi:tyrosine kinase receptor Cad96Ca isoform X2 [Aphidius gifuensis]|uniref:tyrosine kinase receptor Cad96Ca isoform X2 n=1 Tax=Aphidius gifuensis TaxID=684658 RepID=UPI001CDD1CFD|nr:tyrosine kinase receptor Cad96Ca isoform X2 [Aphidius gifuensis]